MQKKLSIVQVIDILNVGGAERVLVTLANILQRNDHDVSVLTTVSKGALLNQLHPAITVINLARKSKWNLKDMRRLIKILRKFDVVHVHSSYNLRYVFLAATIFGMKKKIFFHEHFGDIEINTGVVWHQRFVYPKTIMICVSRKLRDWATKKVGMKEEKVFLLPNIVIKDSWTIPEHKEQSTGLQFLMVANIRPTKNIEFAVELIAALIKTLPVHLTIIGQKTDEAYYEKLINLINEKDIAPYITFKNNITAIQPLLQDFDIAIHTAKSESGPLVLIEYMAQGLPFVTFNTGEVVEQIINDTPQLVIDSFSVDKWMERIQELTTQPQQQLQQQLTTLYDRYFSSEAYYQKCLNIYETGLAIKQ